MKKYLFLLCAFCTAITSQAQFKILSNGTASLQRESATGNATLSVGTLPSDSLHNYDNWKMGIRSYAYDSGSSHCIGVFGEASHQNTIEHKFSAGVWGMGGGAYSGMNYGVLGAKHTGQMGTGIYGTNQDDSYWSMIGNFAGYFYGPVHVEGYVYSTVGFVTTSDMRLKENVKPVWQLEEKQGSTLERLSGLEVIEYNLTTPQQKERNETANISDGVRETDKAMYDIRHIGVSAQELQKMFPNLVHEGQDGYLSVNYVEMVPLLLRSIQELKQELDEIKGTDNTVQKARRNDTSYNDEQTNDMEATEVATGNRLYQNSPNPFTERTEIRFSLADDARNAYIYIFDMTGKTLKQIPVDVSMQSVTVNGYELSSGIYLYSLVVNGQEIDTKRMILSK